MTTSPMKPVAVKRAASAKGAVTKPAKTPVKAARPTPKPTTKTASRSAPAATPLAKTVVPVAADKAEKPKKPKLVRDSFTIPKPEYGVLDELKQRAAKLAQPAKKSELLRAGIKALAAMADSALLLALKAVPAIKTGRPKN